MITRRSQTNKTLQDNKCISDGSLRKQINSVFEHNHDGPDDELEMALRQYHTKPETVIITHRKRDIRYFHHSDRFVY